MIRPTGYALHVMPHAIDGCVPTNWGYVRVYSDHSLTVLTFIQNGVEHQRRFDRGYKSRRLVTLAARFAREHGAVQWLVNGEYVRS